MSNRKPIEEITTPLTEAVKIGDLEIVKSIVNHRSFDPIRSQIIASIFNSIKTKNLNLFKFLVELNGGEINLKNIKNKSLLCTAASTGGNPLILKEILFNEKFDPIESDIQKSFLNSTDSESMKILVSYDEDHKTNLLSIDKISCEFLLRKNGLLPTLPSICINIVMKDHRIYQRMYICKTCRSRQICEICARVCHKGHEIYEAEYQKSHQIKCNCGNDCKCKSNVNIIHDELYDKFKAPKEQKKENKFGSMSNYNEKNFDENEDEELEEQKQKCYNMDEISNECEKKDIKSLKCTLDLAVFNSMSQPMYHCRKCKVDICQSCAIRCHKDHPLNFKGFKSNVSCQCFEATDCCCTSRKNVVCTYAIYGTEYFYQPFYNCKSCAKNTDFGCCTACTKKCHKGHNVNFKENCECFCNCGGGSLPFKCNAMTFPPFNYLSSCTNREQNIKFFASKSVSLIIDGTTSWNKTFYEFSLFVPGDVRHYGLFQVDTASSDNIKKVINDICNQLHKSKILVVGVTTDNGPNLVAALKKIENDITQNNSKFPLIRFSCAAHTAQLLIEDLYKSNSIFSDTSKDILSLIVWLRKRPILRKIKSMNMQSPPRFAPTRWNSICICSEYIVSNYQSILNTIHFFETKKTRCSVQLNEELKSKIFSIEKVLTPLTRFTNKVQQNFVTLGDVYCYLLDLTQEIKALTDNYNFASTIYNNIFKRFTETCDSTLAMLCFVLTNNGRIWWRNHYANRANEIQELLHDEQRRPSQFMLWFNNCETLLVEKIANLAKYLKI